MKKFCMVTIVLALVPAALVHAEKGLAVYEAWLNLRAPGTGEPVFQPLYENPNYPFRPDVSYTFTNFNGPRDWADNYGARLYAYVIVPETGDYTFYICSDDQSELYLSKAGWPDTKAKIAEVLTYCAGSPPSWAEFPGQKSALISLVQNQIIYVEGIMREGGGSDNIYIGWQGPGMADIVTIPGTVLSTLHPKAPSGPVPANGAEEIATNTQLSWVPPSDVNDVATYKVYFGNEPNVVTMPLLADVGTATTANPGQLQTGKTYYWRVETTHSNNGKPFTIRGNFWQFTTVPPIPVIKTQPQNVFLMPGEVATFTCKADSETALTYKWFKVGTPDTEVGAGDTLTIPDVQTDAQYYCNVTNSGGTVKSNTANLKIKRLIAYYPFEGNANDASGFGPNGTWNGTEAYAAGMVGQAASLDGSTSFVVFGSVGISGNLPRTVCAWAKSNVPAAQVVDWTNIFGFTSTPDGITDMSFDLEKIGGTTQYGIHVYGWERTMANIDMNWHFLAATFDGTTIRWYFDGVTVNSEVHSTLNTQDNVQMGKRGHAAGGNWPGLVDDARIYNYALDPAQIAQLYVDVKPDARICPVAPTGDFNGDCKVNMLDFAELARIWMECGRIPVSECAK
jgi:hypothetical protein